ncbi:hypothetical protein P6F34_gp22 [Pseudomonas phage MiCath]|uniref:Uncharacterized protein n=1 Tax=Pseudomonas phage MiCath TaxID=3003729 RepID=A0AAF0AEJ9_9CAUD|nr:hypothetical protein P6F34_gp22 [Pseudomonas phage MiCath]WAX22375.1 hypothetical protein [Pseudomonas phage MiCath]
MSDEKKVVSIAKAQPGYMDVAKALRDLADEIESGAIGDVKTCALALNWVQGEERGIEVFGMGPISSEFDVAALFRLAEHDMLMRIFSASE